MLFKWIIELLVLVFIKIFLNCLGVCKWFCVVIVVFSCWLFIVGKVLSWFVDICVFWVLIVVLILVGVNEYLSNLVGFN